MEVPEPRVANPYVFIVGCPRSGTTPCTAAGPRLTRFSRPSRKAGG